MRPASIVLKPAVIKRRLHRLKKAIAALCSDLEALEGRIPVPSRRELQSFEAGTSAFTPESVLFGLVRRSRSALLEIFVLISDMVAIPPDELRRWGLDVDQTALVLDEIRSAHAALRRARQTAPSAPPTPSTKPSRGRDAARPLISTLSSKGNCQ